jgi:hypothetical protein
MNLIGNNCASGFYYKFSGIEFNNPFVWCLLTPEDMIYLIKNYESIDFTDIELTRLDDSLFKNSNLIKQRVKEHRNIIGIKINNKITTYYVHYLFDGNCEKPITNGIDVFYNRNFEYTYEKYNKRLNRNGLQENPTFLIVAYSFHGWNFDLLNELCKINTNKKIIIITNFDPVHNNNVYIIKDSLKNLDTESLTKSHFYDIKRIMES